MLKKERRKKEEGKYRDSEMNLWQELLWEVREIFVKGKYWQTGNKNLIHLCCVYPNSKFWEK